MFTPCTPCSQVPEQMKPEVQQQNTVVFTTPWWRQGPIFCDPHAGRRAYGLGGEETTPPHLAFLSYSHAQPQQAHAQRAQAQQSHAQQSQATQTTPQTQTMPQQQMQQQQPTPPPPPPHAFMWGEPSSFPPPPYVPPRPARARSHDLAFHTPAEATRPNPFVMAPPAFHLTSAFLPPPHALPLAGHASAEVVMKEAVEAMAAAFEPMVQ